MSENLISRNRVGFERILHPGYVLSRPGIETGDRVIICVKQLIDPRSGWRRQQQKVGDTRPAADPVGYGGMPI